MVPNNAFVEDHVYTLPGGFAPDGMTAGGHVFGLWPQPDGQWRFVWDGVPSDPFDGVVSTRDGSGSFWSDDGCHLAYIGSRAGRAFVGRDGAEDRAFDSISGSVPPTLSARGEHLAYGALAEGVHRLILDGSAISEEPLAPIAPALSADGSRLAFVEAQSQDDSTAGQRIVIDGVPGPWFRGMRNARGVMQFSPDGRRFAYYRIDAKGGARWVVDGVGHRWINDVRPLGLAQIRGVGVLDPPMVARFSPDGSRFAYAADVKEKGVAMIEDDQPGPSVRGCGVPMFSNDGRRFGYTVETHTKRGAIVVDGAMGREWEHVSSELVFSPDGRRVAAGIWREEGGLFRKRRVYAMTVDDEVIGELPGIDSGLRPVFSPDGSRLAWWVETDNSALQLFVDGEPVGGQALSEPSFSSSGGLAYVSADEDGETVVLDGHAGPPSLGVLTQGGGLPRSEREGQRPFRLSPDGEHVAWVGLFDESGGADAKARNQGLWPRPVYDDHVGAAYDQILSWSFDEHGSAMWWAVRGDEVIRVLMR